MNVIEAVSLSGMKKCCLSQLNLNGFVHQAHYSVKHSSGTVTNIQIFDNNDEKRGKCSGHKNGPFEVRLFLTVISVMLRKASNRSAQIFQTQTDLRLDNPD